MQKKLVRTIFIFITALPFLLSFTWHNGAYDLLTKQDWDLPKQEKLRGIPALSSAVGDENKWESYNEWKCFSVKDIDLECASLDENDSHHVPIITIQNKDESHDYEYALGTEYDWNCQKVMESWVSLLEDQKSICLYGAYLPSEEKSDTSLWEIDQIKTQNGYWKMQSYHEFLSDDE